MKIQDIRHLMPFSNMIRPLSQITKIVVHHSATPTGNAQGFMRYHTQTLGWGTSGYHEVILRDGTVQLCYNPEQTTNGVGGHNSYTYHICLVGNGSFTIEQIDALVERLEYNIGRLNINVRDIVGHNDMPRHTNNLCPGMDLSIVRQRLINRIKKKVVKSVQELSTWAIDAQRWIAGAGISDGSRPKDTVTREEMWTMMHRHNNLIDEKLKEIKDMTQKLS